MSLQCLGGDRGEACLVADGEESWLRVTVRLRRREGFRAVVGSVVSGGVEEKEFPEEERVLGTTEGYPGGVPVPLVLQGCRFRRLESALWLGPRCQQREPGSRPDSPARISGGGRESGMPWDGLDPTHVRKRGERRGSGGADDGEARGVV